MAHACLACLQQAGSRQAADRQQTGMTRILRILRIYTDESGLKRGKTPKSPKGDFFKLLIFSSFPLGVRGKNDKNQQFYTFLDWTHRLKEKIHENQFYPFHLCSIDFLNNPSYYSLAE